MSENEFRDSSIQLKIVSLNGELLEDRKRVRVRLELSSDDHKPNVELSLLDETGNEIAHTLILGMIGSAMTFTLHLGKYPGDLPVRVRAAVRTDENILLDERIESVK